MLCYTGQVQKRLVASDLPLSASAEAKEYLMSHRVAHARPSKLVALIALALAALLLAGPAQAQAEVLYLPNVTKDMSDPSFWSQKLTEPNRVLASPSEISALNQQILADTSTNMYDLKNWTQDHFDGVAYGQALRQAALDDAQYYYNVGWARYDKNKHYYETWDEALADFYTPILDNCVNEYATEDDELLYGICTTRGYILCFPSHEMILDDPNDPDFDYQYQTALRVNEPVIIKGISRDGQYYHVISSCTQGWVDKSQVALCASRDQWLDAWDIPDDEVLVVYDDKIQTEDSNYAPQTANVTLPMGSCLRLAATDELGDVLAVTNRSGHNNHVVWMPVRNDDGTYAKQLALIPEHCKVSEGYLPLTASNVISVSLNYLGNAYGWGGMLASEDCSGYVRDVYRCFGLDLPRNTTWQVAAPVQKYSLEGMTDEEKAEVIKTLPPGSTLFFNGHEMTYLGCDNDLLYVISNISSVVLDNPQVTNRIRCCVINTLQDIKRRSGKTWLGALEDATVPFFGADHEPWSDGGRYLLVEGDGGQWKPGESEGLNFVVKRSTKDDTCFDHFTGISIDSVENDGSAYEAQRGSVRLTLKDSYLANLTAGSHSLVFHFDDGDDVAASFSVAEAETYGIACSSTGEGTVAASQTSAVPGASITVTLTPEVGNSSTGVALEAADGSAVEATMVNVNTYTFDMPASDVKVEGSFEVTPPPIRRYAIEIEQVENGSASAAKRAMAGALVTVTLTPDVGYASQGVTVTAADGTDIATTRDNENSYSFEMPGQNVTVKPAFAKADEPVTYPVTLNQADHGSAGASVSEAPAGDVVTVTLTPDQGYASKGISIRGKDGSSVTAERINENSYRFEMPAQAVSIDATFEKATDAGNGSSSGGGSTKDASTGKMPKTGDPSAPVEVLALLAAVGACFVGLSVRMRKRA